MPKAIEDDTADNTDIDTSANTSVTTTTASPGVDFKIQTAATSVEQLPYQEIWFKTYWRPAMGWLYMTICAFDFILAPIMMAVLPILPFVNANVHYSPWDPLTLKAGGLIHLAFGAVLGITAWGRTKERIAGSDPE